MTKQERIGEIRKNARIALDNARKLDNIIDKAIAAEFILATVKSQLRLIENGSEHDEILNQ